LHAVLRKKPDIHDIRVIVNPEVLNRLKTEDEELLVEIERKYSGRLTFRTDPTFHHEKFVLLDAQNNQELKP
jgi:ribonuclease G